MAFATRTFAFMALLTALLVPQAAAQEPGSTDPEAGSPAAGEYEIPVEDARRDGAPRSRDRGGSGGTAGSGSSGGTGGSTSGGDATQTGGSVSSLRTENGFGSSSSVPGADRDDRDGAAAGGGRGGSSGGDGGVGGSPSGEDVGGRSQSLEELVQGSSATATAGSSRTRALLLIGLGVLVALALGAAANRAARSR